MIRFHRFGLFLALVGSGFAGLTLLARADGISALPKLASSEELKEAANTERKRIRSVLEALASAVQKDDEAAALALLPTSAELAEIMPPDAATRSYSELTSAFRAHFAELRAAYAAFGSCTILELDPGTPRKLASGQGGLIRDVLVSERASLAFAREATACIELRFRVGGLLRLPSGKWVLMNLSLKQEEIEAARQRAEK